ncbi:hypothetical protein [uncultured Alistipes sp.]|uniref:hypothetical protein n=1 Tax=uncultured Alistipes sp. TaxID=538949 RepID=UPI0034274199
MTDNHQIAVSAAVVLRDAHPAAEGRIDGVARLQRQVDALMRTAAAQAVASARMGRRLVGAMVAARRVDQFEHDRRGHRRQVGILVGEERRRIPVLLEDGAVAGDFAVADIAPRVVAVEDDEERLVARIERIDDGRLADVGHRLDFHTAQTPAQLGERIGSRLFGGSCRRCGARCGGVGEHLGLLGQQLAERINLGGLPVGQRAERVGFGRYALRLTFEFGTRRAGRTGRRGAGGRKGKEGQQVSLHNNFNRRWSLFVVNIS